MLTSSVRGSSGKEKVEKNSELDWRWLSWARMELDVPFRETGDDGGKSGIQIMYLLKEFLPISYKNNIHLDNYLMLLSLVPDAPRLS